MFTRIYTTHLRIYISAAIIRGTPPNLYCPFRCRQHDNTRKLNRTDATNKGDFDARGGTKHSIVAEIHVMEGAARAPVQHQHTCVVLTCPPPYLSSGNYPRFVQKTTKDKEHLRWMRGTKSSTPHNGLPTSSLILLHHANTAVLSCSFKIILIAHSSPLIRPPRFNSVMPKVAGMYHRCHFLL